ncbi:hypothetical protein CSB07_01065 [Candidatus Gracilibacteria bacterium]|nr:MAG: hypothetical protein CSB07_01065 [Candidatus Gracilibacteria bacterium]PIE84907.1 MAG: hypothetical protein CSA08_04775 [Candidatus Gracilibacteria bacterium]
MFTKISISNILIIISLFFTVLLYKYPEISVFGMNSFYLDQGKYHIYFLQFFTSTFLHGGIIHFLSNALFIFIFGNTVELIIGKRNYLIFYIFSVFFIGLGLTFLGEGNTIGISGFCMATLAYYTLKLKSIKNPDYKGGITAMVINVGIGFYPGISLFGHLFGVIAGVIFYYLLKDFLKRALIPIEET